MIYSSFDITNNTSIEKKYDLSPRKQFSFSLPLVIRVHIFLTCRLFEVVNKWGQWKRYVSFLFLFSFFFILFTFSLWTGRWEQIGAIEEMCNHFSSLAPYSTPVASNAQIHSNPSAPSTIFSRHMSTSFDQKESTYLFALDITCIWSSHSKKTCSFKIPKEIWAPFY